MASEQNEELWQQASPLLLPSAAATQSLGALVAQAALGFLAPSGQQKSPPPSCSLGSTSGLVILLEGNLGSGKTTFVQGLGQGLGIPEPIDSPTFVLVQEYHTGRIPLFHCDLYRLETSSAARAGGKESTLLEDLGLEELWSQGGITAIEWPQYLRHLPATYLWLRLQPHPQQEGARLLHVKGKGAQTGHLWQQVLSQFTQQNLEEGIHFSS
jgi:tRNA threonylcarbamoyladenosine biosynthesis protein TsaE